MIELENKKDNRLTDKLVSFMTPFQWFEVLVLIGFTAYFAAVDKESSVLYLVINSLSAICGVFCVVLCASGKRSQYYFGFVNIAAYIVIAMTSKYYGQVALNALYYLPTQFIGMYMWKKHMNEDINAVKSKKMSPKQVGGYIFVTALGIVGCQYILELLGGKQTWLDSTTLIISIVANALMVLRYKEQWALWIVVDIITVTMWILAGDMIQVSMWSVYLLNAFYGFYKWSKMNKVNFENE
ncbi:nicotinamide riboside transporter PnuC [Ruminiclostridium hungatei]|uniref:Nicotinamide riboside transporter PnuC n=1 Tax=Ruminiclostridium hungatei TaxID=48256 RepID=A0A1V4SFT0_RUMHU|nr:nicotinamide riboside transporter PnuC [Ruminiclostridium hungatei]OPX42772.1 nicotinamide riboside transporter PnuC [Ruminiclostridium hungatei]